MAAGYPASRARNNKHTRAEVRTSFLSVRQYSRRAIATRGRHLCGIVSQLQRITRNGVETEDGRKLSAKTLLKKIGVRPRVAS